MNDLDDLEGEDFADNEEVDGTPEAYHAEVSTNSVNVTTLAEEYDYDVETNLNSFFWDELLPTLIVYSLTFILGLVGNILIIFTTFRYRKMKSTTNVFLASLASADLLLIVFCIPVKVNLYPVINENVNRMGSFRQRKSMKYAREWLDTIRLDPKNLKFENIGQCGENSPEDQTSLVKVKPLQETLLKASPGPRYNSSRNYSKYRENLRESQKIRNRIHDSFLRCWNQTQRPAELTEESRDLVPLRRVDVSECMEKEIGELSRPEKSKRKDASNDLCHPLLHPFLEGGREGGRRVIAMNGINGEAIVIYRRNGLSRINNWRNYQFQQIAIGKANFDLPAREKTGRSSSETRGIPSPRQVCIPRRRRSKFRCEPVKLGRSVSIEFKKFDEIREMFHPNEPNPIPDFNVNENSLLWKSNEFRLRSSAVKKLNLFKEMRKSERRKRKKIHETTGNRRLAVAVDETPSSITMNMSSNESAGKEGAGERKDESEEESTETVESALNPSPSGDDGAGRDKESNETESTASPSDKENSPLRENRTDRVETLKGLSKQPVLHKLRDILDEIVSNEEKMNESKESPKNRKCDSNVPAFLMNFLGKDPLESSELEELTLTLKTMLKNCAELLKTEETNFNEGTRTPGKLTENGEFPEGTLIGSVTPIIAYPVSVSRSQRNGREFYGTEEDFESKITTRCGDGSRDREIDRLRRGGNDQRRTSRKIGETEPFVMRSVVENESRIGDVENVFTSMRASDNSARSWNGGEKPERERVKKEPSPIVNSPETPTERGKPVGKGKHRACVERKIMKLDRKLKDMLHRIGVCPTKDQVAIKKCLEKLRETSEALLRRLRTDRFDSCHGYCGDRGDLDDPKSKGNNRSDPPVKVNMDKTPLVIKASGSEIQLNVGMEITMENFDPVTGRPLSPEENRDFEQKGNIQCKLMKSGDNPVTFIDTDFLYNPKTGMLFQKGEKTYSNYKSKELKESLKPTKTYLISKTTKRNFPPDTDSDSSERNSGEREETSEKLRPTGYRGRDSSPETSKSVLADAFRLAIEREEMKNARSLREGGETSRSLPWENPRCTGRPSSQRRVSLNPMVSPNQKYGSKEVSDRGFGKIAEKKTHQAYHLQENSQAGRENAFWEGNPAETVMVSDKGAQTNLGPRTVPDSVERKSTGIQTEMSKEKVLVNRAADTTFLGTPLWALRRGVNVCVQTSSCEMLPGTRRGSDVSSQTDFLIEEAQKYMRDLETQKRVNLAIAELCYHLSNGAEVIDALAKLFSYTWTFGFFICKLVYYMQSVSAICSVLTLTAMSVERYYAIMHPMRAQYVCTIGQARRIITFTWISSFFLAIPVLFAQIHMPVGVRVKGFWCVRDYDNPTIWRAHETYMLLLILIIPTGVMGVAYTTICLEIWQVMQRRQDLTSAKILNIRYNKASVNSDNFSIFGKEKKQQRHTYGESPDDEAHVKQVIKMLVAVVVIYVVCWAPLLIDNILQAYDILPFMKFGKQKYMATAFHLMAYFNSCINPIVYGFMSKNFRDSFHKTLCCSTRKEQTSLRNASMSHDRNTSIRYAESSFGRTVSIAMPD